ncbi:hypothetical protein FUA48_07275 [Flavobacterium alkalisoli]|uniref:DUF3299 domain-containing protein n=1 Tax=Flavobacterium alkalisoli TaxID=2602769 RepID=A0A5B9FXD2_9FLAO|nr:hypothetical protein [Flavobacterium alkalisoli]QEE49387.1 hypothetical protein FUA48_07275 [Flavobacterium alkalisoli]
MRKNYFIVAVIMFSGLMLMSLRTPSLQNSGFTTTNTKADNTAVFSDTLSWKLLGQIKYIKKSTDDYPEGVMFPVVNPTLKAKSKKTIIMSGFIIPIDNKSYALSKNVFASCFFCGQAGPETIMGIKFKNPNMKLKTDQYVTLEGTFRYNDSDVDDWIYHIENAVIIKG